MSEEKQEENALASRKIGVVKHEINPFIKDLTIEIGKKFTRIDGGTLTTGQGTGAEAEHKVAQITQVTPIDKEKFVKVFTDELRTFFDLKKSTQKILHIVLVELQKVPGKDQIYLDHRHAIRFFTDVKTPDGKPIMSKPTFYKALKELISKEFLAESTQTNQYYINPALFFNGDRLKLVKEYVVTEKAAASERKANINKETGECDPPEEYKLEQEVDTVRTVRQKEKPAARNFLNNSLGDL
jgi:hypothetical protein